MRGETGEVGTSAGRISSARTGFVPDSVVSSRTISSAREVAAASAIAAAWVGSVSVARTLSRTVLVGLTAETWPARAEELVSRSRSSMTGSRTPGESTTVT